MLNGKFALCGTYLNTCTADCSTTIPLCVRVEEWNFGMDKSSAVGIWSGLLATDHILMQPQVSFATDHILMQPQVSLKETWGCIKM